MRGKIPWVARAKSDCSMSILERVFAKVPNLYLLKLEEFAWKNNICRGKVGLKYVQYKKPPFFKSPQKSCFS